MKKGNMLQTMLTKRKLNEKNEMKNDSLVTICGIYEERKTEQCRSEMMGSMTSIPWKTDWSLDCEETAKTTR